ncbi:MAG: hypothetical protein PHY34_02500 [Patescibacteria group bacterium]|nr:hypothetical protein [Patescibacteria group bacterium]MDD5715485.1 hypothetical protein [Patescibacteria group bacterium]
MVERGPIEYGMNSSPDREARERGRDVQLIIRLGRHGDKEPGQMYGLLSPRGEQSTKDYGRSFTATEQSGLKGYASGQQRADRTRDNIVGSASDETFIKLDPRQRKELDYSSIRSFPEGGWVKYGKQYLEEHYPQFDSLAPDVQLRAMQEAEDFLCNKALQDPVYTEEAASNIGHFVDTQIRMADHLKSGSRAVLVDVSHNTPLTCFLSKCLIIEDPETGEERRGFQGVEEIGGSFKPVEFVELDVTIDQKGEKTVVPRFGDIERLKGLKWRIDMEELKRLSQAYIEAHRYEEAP